MAQASDLFDNKDVTDVEGLTYSTIDINLYLEELARLVSMNNSFALIMLVCLTCRFLSRIDVYS